MSTGSGRTRILGLHALMEQYVDGNRRAFETMHTLMEPRLRGFLMNLVRDPAAVDDLLQLTLLKAHLARERFRLQGGDPDGAVQGWYFAIARNVAMDHMRDRHREKKRMPGSAADDGTDPVANLAAREPTVEDGTVETEREQDVVDRVRAAIARLPPGQREVVEMHKLKGMTMAEVADRLSVREGAVRVRAHRAYKALARFLMPAHD